MLKFIKNLLDRSDKRQEQAPEVQYDLMREYKAHPNDPTPEMMEDRLGLLVESQKDLAEWRAQPALDRVEVKPLPNGYYQDIATPSLVYSQLELDRLSNLYKDVHIAMNEPTANAFEQNYQYLQANLDDTSKMLETAEQRTGEQSLGVEGDIDDSQEKPFNTIEVKELDNGFFEDVLNPGILYSQNDLAELLESVYENVIYANEDSPRTRTAEQIFVDNALEQATNVNTSAKTNPIELTPSGSLEDLLNATTSATPLPNISSIDMETSSVESMDNIEIEEFETSAELEAYLDQENEVSLV